MGKMKEKMRKCYVTEEMESQQKKVSLQILPEFCSEVRSAENEYENGNSKKENEFCQNAIYAGDTRSATSRQPLAVSIRPAQYGLIS